MELTRDLPLWNGSLNERVASLNPAITWAAVAILALLRPEFPTLQLVSAFRTRKEQQDLWERAQRDPGRAPAAAPGNSQHEIGCAFDLSGDPAGLARAGSVAPLFGLRWGGNFERPDVGHFEVDDDR